MDVILYLFPARALDHPGSTAVVVQLKIDDAGLKRNPQHGSAIAYQLIAVAFSEHLALVGGGIEAVNQPLHFLQAGGRQNGGMRAQQTPVRDFLRVEERRYAVHAAEDA